MSYNYHQLLKYVYFEGYANSYEEAEYFLNQLNNEEYEELNESRRKLAHSFPLNPSEKLSVANIGRMNRGDFSVPPKGKVKPEPEAEPEEPKPRRRRTDMSKVIVAHYLFDEGYAETIESAELIAESISDEWARQILEVKGGGKVPFTGNTSDRGMPTNPSDKLYRKKIKVETDMEDEEKRIRTRNRAQQPDEYNELRPGSKKSQRRSATASRETRTSPIMQSLQKRFERLSDADDNMRNRR